MTQNPWDTTNSKREVYNNSFMPQETRKITNKQYNPTPKATRGRRTKKIQSQQEGKNHKDQIRDK